MIVCDGRKLHVHTEVLIVTLPMDRASKGLRQSKQLPMAISKPAKHPVVLPTLFCLCQHPKARETDDELGVKEQQPFRYLPTHSSETREPTQQGPSLPQLCPPSSALFKGLTFLALHQLCPLPFTWKHSVLPVQLRSLSN